MWPHNVWNSRGFIMVNGVPREVQRPKPEGPQATRVFPAGLPQGTPFTMIHPKLFHTFSFFCHPGLPSKEGFLSLAANPTSPQGVLWSICRAWISNIGRGKSQYTGPGCRKNVECPRICSGPALQKVSIVASSHQQSPCGYGIVTGSKGTMRNQIRHSEWLVYSRS